MSFRDLWSRKELFVISAWRSNPKRFCIQPVELYSLEGQICSSSTLKPICSFRALCKQREQQIVSATLAWGWNKWSVCVFTSTSGADKDRMVNCTFCAHPDKQVWTASKVWSPTQTCKWTHVLLEWQKCFTNFRVRVDVVHPARFEVFRQLRLCAVMVFCSLGTLPDVTKETISFRFNDWYTTEAARKHRNLHSLAKASRNLFSWAAIAVCDNRREEKLCKVLFSKYVEVIFASCCFLTWRQRTTQFCAKLIRVASHNAGNYRTRRHPQPLQQMHLKA